jgi:hypothetical protein
VGRRSTQAHDCAYSVVSGHQYLSHRSACKCLLLCRFFSATGVPALLLRTLAMARNLTLNRLFAPWVHKFRAMARCRVSIIVVSAATPYLCLKLDLRSAF